MCRCMTGGWTGRRNLWSTPVHCGPVGALSPPRWQRLNHFREFRHADAGEVAVAHHPGLGSGPANDSDKSLLITPMVKISLITATYNAADTVADSLRSAAMQKIGRANVCTTV